MGKHADAVKPFADFRAPWETEAGDEAEIDKPKLKRYIHNLVADKAKAQDSRDDTEVARKSAETERDEAKADAEKASPDESNKKVAKLTKDLADVTAERDTLVSNKERDDLRSEVLGDLDPKYAKYVNGETRDELEKALEDVKKDFGLDDKKDKDEDDENDEVEVRTRPRSKLTNGSDPDSGKGGSDEIDFDKVADDILGRSIFH